MEKYIIGILDDVADETAKIRYTIKNSILENIEIEFKEYFNNLKENLDLDLLEAQILKDIENNNISTLIIDEKIIMSSKEIHGSKVFEKIKSVVEKFPMIILTNWVEDVERLNIIDPDKIYDKQEFFDLNTAISNKLIKNIFANAKMYSKNRNNIERKIQDLEKKISNEGTSSQAKTINEISKQEDELRKLKPTHYTQIEKYMKPDEIREVLEILKKANESME